MNAIKLLKSQHRQVKKLFGEAVKASSPAQCQKAATEICDQLAIHATIEEKIFYPESMTLKTADLLRESVEEHLAAKRVIADIMAADASDPQYLAKVTVLKDMIEHHVEEEEGTLFPRIEKLLDHDKLEDMGTRMDEMASALLSKGEPRDAVPGETQGPAPLPKPTAANARQDHHQTGARA